MTVNISGVNINGVNIYDSTGLYNFTTFTFRSGGVVGSVGPTAAQLFANSYSNVGNTWLQSTSFYNTYGNGYQFWTVPISGIYQITAAGARSGYPNYASNPNAGYATVGYGAVMSGAFSLTQGQILTLVVGQASGNAASGGSFSSVGGGGASWVVTSTNSPLVVAGGAGGGGNYASGTPINVKGGNGTTYNSGNISYKGAPGGSNGNGGNSHVASNLSLSMNSYDSGGGGGMYSNGAIGFGGNVRSTVAGNAQTGGGGAAFMFGANGGQLSSTYSTGASVGGFGGGGGSGPITGGGGGGYSGGGGAYTPINTQTDGGGGGGSYLDPSASNVATSDGQYNNSSTLNGSISTVGFNLGNGYITITRL